MQSSQVRCHDGRGEDSESAAELRGANYSKPVIIGLYGLPGSGKSFLLAQLGRNLNDNFTCHDGSQVIAAVTPGGLETFKSLNEDQQIEYRERAMAKVKQECCETGKCAIVAGHSMFWAEEEQDGQMVCTPADLRTYTHILYLDIPPEVIAEYRMNDVRRNRPDASIAHLARWQKAEKENLFCLCRSNEILFMTLSQYQTSLHSLIPLLQDLHKHTEDFNTALAEQQIDQFITTSSNPPETVLVFDADKTLAPQDSGIVFWERDPKSPTMEAGSSPLKEIFSSPLQYSYTAFRQATLLYEAAMSNTVFETRCGEVAAKIKMYAEFVDLLQLVKGQTHVGALVVTCGLRRVWEKVLEAEGISQTVKVIGGGRISDGIVMTPALKKALVERLRNHGKMYIWAFGDSPLDLGMLMAAHQAVVVTGQENTRSRSMDEALAACIRKNGFRPRQVLLPPYTALRLDASRLPVVYLTEQFFMASLFFRRQPLHVLHATESSAAKLLMTPMRNAMLSGPVLREFHRRVGWYLAIEYCTQILGIENYPIDHVQGHQTSGYQVMHEKETLIVPLMRGGEPMAFGVNDAFPLAMFLHAKVTSDIRTDHLRNCATVILVDSVINTGESILEFIQHIRSLDSAIRIVVVAGVVQAQSVSSSEIAYELSRFRRLSFVALRLSQNKFTGKGTTDTGNRLFSTIHLA
ncbi:uncharacterized protein N7511_005504 [Penicillium nucicola]|uniref:uncharacterized protein n=1 Tax=Penicillium nucicola TaxID=1850975 RepID=UPI002544E822|nr:uncharacterized protein N7511_005504 [Penicillium nucicola]KAJ5762122.1 hypothetical protein N7511_005504 [Penicillium nucicola]